MDAIDFSRSQAIVVGTANYTQGLPGMPAAGRSMHAMRSTLVGPRCGWPGSRVALFEDRAEAERVTLQIAALMRDVSDVLLFYYVGHGLLLDDGQLGLALTDTSRAADVRAATSLRFDALCAELTRHCHARATLVILDCCFSDVGEFGKNFRPG